MVGERAKTSAVLRALLLLGLLGCVGGFCTPAPTPPPGDACMNPSTGQVSTAALATARIDPNEFGTAAARDDLSPRRLEEGATLWLIQGGQGSDMVGVRLVLSGADVPKCIAQDTQVTVGGKLAARNRDAVVTYLLDAGDGHATRTIWLPGAFSGAATVTTEVAGQTLTRAVNTAATYSCASSKSCPCSHVLFRCSEDPAVCVEGLGDAGRALYQALTDCRACDGGPCDQAACEPQAQACRADLY